MAQARTAELDDDEPNGEDVLQDIGSAGQGAQTRRANGNANGHDDGDDAEYEIVDGDEDAASGAGNEEDRRNGSGADDEGGDEARFTEADQPSASYLDHANNGQATRSKNVRRREARDRTNAENAALKARLAATEGRLVSVETMLRQFRGTVEPQLQQFSQDQLQNRASQVDNQLARAQADFDASMRTLADALGNNDTEGTAKALEKRDEAFLARARLQGEKAKIAQAIAAGGNRGVDEGASRDASGTGDRSARRTEQPISPRAEAYANEFRARFPWLDPRSGDPSTRDDTAIVSALDNGVMADRYNPDDPQYWLTLENRMRKALPHRFEDRHDDPPPARNNGAARNGNGQRPQQREARRGPPTAAPGNGGAAPAGKIRVKMTQERREALYQGGYIDENGQPTDKSRFNNIMRQYAEIDRANGAAN